jgi:uncharacterized RDD family membrane protein YckC
VRGGGEIIEAGQPLPAGDAIHAGFWRRFAAYTLDNFILVIPMILLNLIPLLGILLFYVGRWLYFALMESGPNQATLGKQAFGLKVTDDYGQPITFARATGRFFGGAVSNIILYIGYMMAGFTERKQALHDLMANTCVVFDTVEPGQEHDLERPPMPWYGWALNVLPFVFGLIATLAYGWFMATLLGGMSQQMSNTGIEEMTQQAEVLSQANDPDAEKAHVRAGLDATTAEVEAVKAEVAQGLGSSNECPSGERPSSNPWIESIQTGGIAPRCSVTVRLSSSSDIPFAARIERIEWTWEGGAWECSSSMDSSYLPWPCQ